MLNAEQSTNNLNSFLINYTYICVYRSYIGNLRERYKVCSFGDSVGCQQYDSEHYLRIKERTKKDNEKLKNNNKFLR